MLIFIVGVGIGIVATLFFENRLTYFTRWRDAVVAWGETINEWGKSRESYSSIRSKYLELYQIVYDYYGCFPQEAQIKIIQYTKKHYPQAYDENGSPKPYDQVCKELEEMKDV